MNELVELNELTVWDTPSINISMPKLPKTDYLYMYNSSSVTLDFASLERATRIDLNGGFLSLNFLLLNEVAESFIICSTPDCSRNFPAESWTNPSRRPLHMGPPMYLDFPVLENVTGVDISGDISLLAMPKLKSALEYDVGDNNEDPGFKIEAWNTPIDIMLPALEKVDSLSIEGTSITSLNLPALKSIPKWFYLQSNTSLEVNLPDLVSADNLTIRGNITSVHLPALTNISTLYIPSWSKDLDCTSAKEAWARVHPTSASPASGTWFYCGLPLYTPYPGYTPKPYPASPDGPFPDGYVSPGLCLVFAIAGIAFVGALVVGWCWARKRKIRKMKERHEARKIELRIVEREVRSRDGEGSGDGEARMGGDENRLPRYEREAKDVPPVYEEAVRTSGERRENARMMTNDRGSGTAGESSVSSGIRHLV